MSRTAHISVVTLVATLSASLALAADFPLALNYNFNGLVHAGEESQPDNPTGYRSISDRGLRIDGAPGSLGTVPIVGFGGIPYSIVTGSGALDLVHLGNRNTVDNGNWAFDPNANGDNTGTQPTWLPDPDQTGPQTTNVTSLNLALDASAEIGVLYQVSNGGGTMRVTLAFTDATSVFVTVAAPDWFQNQSPPGPGAGLSVQRQLGVFNGNEDTDNGIPGASLNLAEAIISVQELLNDGLGNVIGKTLASISFSDRNRPVAGYAIVAATVRTALGPPANDDCANCTPITLGTTSSSNARATGTDITGCGTGDTTDVWFCYTAEATGRAEARLCGSQFDTTLAVYGTCGSGAIACDDNGCGLQSLVQWNATSGQTYRIRVAGTGATIGDFALTVSNPVTQFINRALPLVLNFNGMTHDGEAGEPDNPDGYRSMSDRGLWIDGDISSFASGTVRGTTGIVYSPVRTADVLDMIHIGNRNTVNGGGFVFDDVIDGDDVGIQPNWLPAVDQTGPQTTDIASLNITLGDDHEIGVLYNVSNGGGGFLCALGFTDASSVTLFLSAPDWFGSQPPISPDPGIAVQTELGVFTGTGSVDMANPSLPLNVQEAVITVQELLFDGVGDFRGRTLSSLTFRDADNFNAGYAIYAATVRAPGVPCTGDLNGDLVVGLGDLTLFLSSFGLSLGDPGYVAGADLNGDNVISLGDLTIFLANFGNVCG